MTLDEVLDHIRAGRIRQREIAARAGVTQPTISNLVTGTSHSTSHANALAIIKAAEEILDQAPEAGAA